MVSFQWITLSFPLVSSALFAYLIPRKPAYIRDHDADARCGSLYRIEAAWPYLRENDTGVRQIINQKKDEAVNLVNGLFD